MLNQGGGLNKELSRPTRKKAKGGILCQNISWPNGGMIFKSEKGGRLLARPHDLWGESGCKKEAYICDLFL
jgi:hypothetical protein